MDSHNRANHAVHPKAIELGFKRNSAQVIYRREGGAQVTDRRARPWESWNAASAPHAS